MDQTPLIGSTFPVALRIDDLNGSGANAAGFLPSADLILPNAIQLLGVRVLGSTSSPTGMVNNTNQPITVPHPIIPSGLRSTVTIPAFSTYYFVRIPLSSLTPGAGIITAALDMQMASAPTATAPFTLGTPLPIRGTCLFAYGSDALNDPLTDPVVFRGAADFPVTPSVLRARIESLQHVVTGPSWEDEDWTVFLEVAAGVTVNNVRVTDVLPSGFVGTRLNLPVGALDMSNLATGNVDVVLPTLTGVAGQATRIGIVGYVPERDRLNNQLILDPTTGNPMTLNDTVRITYDYSSQTGLAINPDPQATLIVNALLIRETITNLGTLEQPFTPGQRARIALEISVSDYFDDILPHGGYRAARLRSILGPGVDFDAQSLAGVTFGGLPITPTSPCGAAIPFALCPNSETQLDFDLGALRAGRAGAVSLIYDVLVRELYQNNSQPVLGGDVIPTLHQITSSPTQATSPAPYPQSEQSSWADQSIPIGRIMLSKSIYQVNGQPFNPGRRLLPGDVVTWRVTLDQSSGDENSLAVTDFVPLPIFDVREHGATPTFPSPQFRFGPSHTVPTVTSGNNVAPTVTLSTSAGDNSLTFTFTRFATSPSRPVTVDLLFDYTVLARPQEDGLVFTNLAAATANGTVQAVAAENTTYSFQTLEPDLVMLKQAVAFGGNASTSATITGTIACGGGPFDPYTSGCLSGAMPTGVTGVDARDTITFVTVLENRGSQTAYNVMALDMLPSGLTLQGTLSARFGNGSPITLPVGAETSFFGAGLSLPDIPAVTTDGSNVIVLRYTVMVNAATPAARLFDNVASISNFTSLPGAQPPENNFVTVNPGRYQSVSRVSVSDFVVAKSASPASATIGDTVSYTVTVTIPEGQNNNVVVTDVLPPELLYLTGTATITDGSGGAVPAPTFAASGQTLTWTFPTPLVNNANDSDAEIYTFRFNARVNNVASAVAGATVANVVQLGANGTTFNAPPANLSIIEPRLTITKSLDSSTPGPFDAGDTVRIVVSVRNDGLATAYDVQTTVDNFAGLDNVTPASQNFASIAPGATAMFTISATVSANAPIGGTIPVDCSGRWTSQPGATPFERTGSGTPAQNNYRTTASFPVPVRSFTLTKTPSVTHIPIGGEYSYHVVVPVPEGSASLSLSDLLPAGLTFLQLRDFQQTASVFCLDLDSVAGDCTSATVGPPTNPPRWNFGTVSNTEINGAPQQLSFDIDVHVDDVMILRFGSELVNTIELNGGSPVAAAPVTVIEATPGASLFASPAFGDAADVIVINTMIRNDQNSQGNGADAYDFTLIYSPDPTMFRVLSATVPPGCPLLVSVDTTANTVTYSGDLPLGADCPVTFTGVLGNNVAIGSNLGLVGAAMWSSLPGNVPGERLYPYPAENRPAMIGTYIPIDWPYDITKTNVSGLTTVALGQRVMYDLRVSMGEGRHRMFTLTERPPAGLQIVSARLQAAGPGATVPPENTWMLTPAAPGSGQPVAINLGEVAIAGDNNPGADPNTDFITVRVTADVVFDPAIRNNPATSNVADISSTDDRNGPPTPTLRDTSNSVPVNFILPEPVISLTANNTTPRPGDSVTFTATLDNANGTDQVCNTTVTVVIPPGFTITNSGGGTVSGQTVTFPVTGCVAARAALSQTVIATANAQLSGTPVDATATLGDYSNLPSGGVVIDPNADGADTNDNGTIDEANDDTARVRLTPAVPVLAFTKAATSATVPAGSVIGYTLTVTNSGGGPATGVTISDTLPTLNAMYVMGSVSPPATVTGNVLTATVATLAPGSSFAVTFQLRARNPQADGSGIDNVAFLSTTDGYYTNSPSNMTHVDVTPATGVCSSDTQCLAAEWCSETARDCRPDYPNGSGPCANEPTIDHNGGRNQCVSDYCDSRDQLCGAPNSTPCTTSVICRSNICFTDNRCGLPNNEPCTSATMCRSGICDGGTCGAPNNDPCGSDAQCKSDVCHPSDGLCGKLDGEPCTQASECRDGVCNSDGRCGNPTGTPCTTPMACRSDICRNGTCQPSCTSDNDCPVVDFCDTATDQCTPDLPNGTACTRRAQCRSDVCFTDGQCGLPDGQACTAATMCRSGACSGGVCGSSCTSDSDCPASQFCNASGSCVPDLPNGDPCTRVAQCVSGICSADGLCGVPDGLPCRSAVDCRSAACDVDGTCGPSCTQDAQCRRTDYCDTTQSTCEPTTPNETACTRNQMCTSEICASNGQCGEPNGDPCGDDLQCRSNVCFPGDTRCGLPNNEPCTAAEMCRSNVCYSDGSCGTPNNEACTADSECRAGRCLNGTCVGCANDGDCPNNQYCDGDTGSCVDQLPDGSPCTRPRQCRIGVCDAEGLCTNRVPVEEISVSGGGCGVGGRPDGGLVLLGAALALLVLGARRRRLS